MKTNYDYIRLDEADLPLQPNGFLNIPALISRTGVFTYYEESPDGTFRIIRQLRHPDEVFAEESLETLVGLPTTNNHPSELEVRPENASDLIVGMTTDRPKRVMAPVQGDEEEYIQQLVTFFDSNIIKLIKDKKKTEMSLGYSCVLDESPGEHNGIKYDFIQREIRYNHLSLVDRARGGPLCRVLVDSEKKQKENKRFVFCDGLFVGQEYLNNKEKPMKVLLIDGKEFKVEDDVYDKFTAAQNKIDSTQKLNDKKQKELDKLQAVNDELKSQVTDDQEKKQTDAFNSAVRERVSLVTKATPILGTEVNFDALTDREIKEKVIKALRKDSVMEGKSDDYVNARFDMLIEDYKPESKDKKDLGDAMNNQTKVYDAAEARQKAWERDQQLWKQPVGLGIRKK